VGSYKGIYFLGGIWGGVKTTNSLYPSQIKGEKNMTMQEVIQGTTSFLCNESNEAIIKFSDALVTKGYSVFLKLRTTNTDLQGVLIHVDHALKHVYIIVE
jgi:hypothetical protein